MGGGWEKEREAGVDYWCGNMIWEGEKLIAFMLVFKGCCNNVPQNEWPKAVEIFSFTVLEARNPKSRCQQGHAPSEVSKGDASLLASDVSGNPWHSLPCRYITPISVSVFI